MPVVALVPMLRTQLEAKGFSADRLHLGATSQDVVDTALVLVSQRALAAARAYLVRTGRSLAALADAERHSPRIARSLARHAEAEHARCAGAGWLDGVGSAIEAIDRTGFPVQFGGAVGTGTAADAAAGSISAPMTSAPRSPTSSASLIPGVPGTPNARPVLAIASTAATVVAALGRIAGDITFLSREEVGEVRLAGGGGSSAMPHKQNPVPAVAVTAAAVEAPALLQVVASAALAGDERSPGRWHAEWSALAADLARLARSSADAASRLVAGAEFDRDRAARDPRATGHAGERARPRRARAASDRIVDAALARFTRLTDRSPAHDPSSPARRVRSRHRTGRGESASRALPSLGTTTRCGMVSSQQLRAARAPRTCVSCASTSPGTAPRLRRPRAFTVADLADAVLAVVDEAGGGAFHVAGASLGGVVALELAVAHPVRVRSLVMSCSGARIGTPGGWAERAASVRASGTASLVTASAARWFAPGFLDRVGGDHGGRTLTTLVDIDDESYALCADALGTFDRAADLRTLAVPMLAISGEHDTVTTPPRCRTWQTMSPAGATWHSTAPRTSRCSRSRLPSPN